jgi:predicted amidohydrolase YtcJ
LIGEAAFDGIEGVGRDANGRMTGVLEEEAHYPVRRCVAGHGDRCDDWLPFMKEVLAFGIGEVHAIDPAILGQDEPFAIYQQLESEGKLQVRFRLYYTERPTGPLSVRSGFGSEWLSYGGHKIFVDGALGDRTAAMSTPFSDTGTMGMLRRTDQELYDTIRESFEKGLQVMAHVIGDRGLDQILSVLERLQNDGVKSEWPMKLTHVQLCRPDQVQKLAKLGVYCDVQPYHLVSDGRFLPYAIGPERFRWCTALGSMHKAGIVVTGGSDAPVDPFDPLEAIHAAVVRRPGYNDAEKISLDEALRMYTINAQKMIKNEKKKGLIKEGYLADIAVFDKDLFAVPAEDLRSCKVVATIVGGVVQYRREEPANLTVSVEKAIGLLERKEDDPIENAQRAE